MLLEGANSGVIAKKGKIEGGLTPTEMQQDLRDLRAREKAKEFSNKVADEFKFVQEPVAVNTVQSLRDKEILDLSAAGTSFDKKRAEDSFIDAQIKEIGGDNPNLRIEEKDEEWFDALKKREGPVGDMARDYVALKKAAKMIDAHALKNETLQTLKVVQAELAREMEDARKAMIAEKIKAMDQGSHIKDPIQRQMVLEARERASRVMDSISELRAKIQEQADRKDEAKIGERVVKAGKRVIKAGEMLAERVGDWLEAGDRQELTPAEVKQIRGQINVLSQGRDLHDSVTPSDRREIDALQSLLDNYSPKKKKVV